MQRRKHIREDGDGWTAQQLSALVLQVIEVAAIVVLAWVAALMSREMKRSQSEIINALRNLHAEVERSEEIK